MKTLHQIGDVWIRRRARPDPTALAAVEGLKPAVVVTGGSRGIGQALAREFAKDTAALVLIARTADRLERVAEHIRSEFEADVITVCLDLRTHDAGDRLDDVLAEAGLYCDVLINNAGIGLGGPFAQQHWESIDSLVALNIQALTRLMHRHLPLMLARGRGGIINLASLGGYVPGPYQAAYYASKAYVLSLTSAAAYEESGRGVRIASVAPGPVQTTFHSAMGAELAGYRILIPPLTPEQVARSARRGYLLGHSRITPGITASIMSRVMTLLPYLFLVPLMGMLLKPRRIARKDKDHAS